MEVTVRQQSKNYDMVDCLKFLMAIGVVSIHVGVPILSTGGRLAVPFFLIISSYFFFRNYEQLDELARRRKMRAYLKRIFLLFLSWEILYLPWTIAEGIKYFNNKGLSPLTLVNYIWNLFFYRNALTGWGASWYLFALIWGLPIFWGCLRILGWNITLAFSVVIEGYYIITSSYFRGIKYSIATSWFLRTFIYLAIGYLLAQRGIHKKIKLTAVGAILVLFFTENLFIWKVLGGLSNSEEIITTAVTALIIVAYALTSSLQCKYAIELRHLSTFIYCGHILMMKFYPYYNLGSNRLVELIVVVAECCVLFYLWKLLERTGKQRLRIFAYMV